MKRHLFLAFILLQMTKGLSAQTYVSVAMGGSYLSVSDVILKRPGSKIGMKGSAIPFDLKIGYALQENFIVHIDFIVTTSIFLNMTADGRPIGNMSGDTSITMGIFGVGCTYYFLPSKFYSRYSWWIWLHF